MRQISYWAMRIDKDYPTEIMDEIRAGRLRQGWGGIDDQDLREVAKLWNWHGGKRSDLSTMQEMTVRHFAFLGLDEPGMMRANDIVLVPNLPNREHFVLCHLLPAGYDYAIHPDTNDHGHIRHVELLTPNGVLKSSKTVAVRLRATLGIPLRLWSLDGYRTEMEGLLASLATTSKWSDVLKTQTRDVIEGRDILATSGGQLCLKHATSGFGTISEDDLWRGVLKVIDRRTKAETIFASADELIAAGWAID